MSDAYAPGRAAAVLLFGTALLALGSSRFAPSAGFGPASTDTAPRAVIDRSETNLGRLNQGEVREAGFALRNAGGRRLVVTGEDRECCGQSMAASSLVVAPGDSAQIRVQVDTSTWCGPLREEFSYTTNDPGCPRLTFTVLGEVVASNPP